MILRLIVCIGTIVFCIYQISQEISIPGNSGVPFAYTSCIVLLLIGLSPKGVITWPIATVILLFEGHYIVGFIPLTLVIFNMIGNELINKGKGEYAMLDFYQTDYSDVRRNFLDYCGAYFIEKRKLTFKQANLLILDPQLGIDLDIAKREWLSEDVGLGNDPDRFLIPKLFDALEMKRINEILDKYADEYAFREKTIKEYLRSIGHPAGGL